MNGMVYVGWDTGCYSTVYSDDSVKALSKTNNDWVSVVWTWYQPTIADTTIASVQGISPSEADIIHFVQLAKQLGLKVAFKPHVDLSSDPSHWRGQIGTNFGSSQWNEWFASYQKFIYYVASIASSTKADMLIVGTELSATESQEAMWRQTISGIRKNFTGPLVYGANWDPFNVIWWDALDYIGVDAYFPLTNQVNPAVATLVEGWQSPLKLISGTAKKYNKSVIFTEIGYQSIANTATEPAGAKGPLNLMAQSNCYEAFFEVFYTLPWFEGVFWWAWGVDPNEGGKCDSDFTPHNKPAELILQKYYNGSVKAIQSNAASYNIYKNGVLNSVWDNYSYSGTINLKDTSVVYPGNSYSLSAQLSPWGAVSLHSSTAFSLTPYSTLVFVIAGAPSVTNSVYLSFYDQNDKPLYSISLENYVSNCTVTSGWQSVSVPLADLFSPSLIDRVNFINYQNANGLFYLDEINFV